MCAKSASPTAQNEAKFKNRFFIYRAFYWTIIVDIDRYRFPLLKQLRFQNRLDSTLCRWKIHQTILIAHRSQHPKLLLQQMKLEQLHSFLDATCSVYGLLLAML